jgi:peptidyl-tRNA hydrolase
VLGKFDDYQTAVLEDIIKTAGEAVINIFREGTEKSMNKFNNTSITKVY